MQTHKFHKALDAWYQANGRHELPWRKTEDPYAIWLSEVMLQQTQVKTVLERFYFPFLERFPSIHTLAEADLQDVLQLWQGLGYYSRAKNFHKAAQQIAAAGLNTLPAEPDALIKLPGIGQNTARAVAAFAFHQPVAILEANVKRVVARIFALETPSDKELWAKAESLLNAEHPFDYNQAMMDVGSTICTPKNPSCDRCPANVICEGKSSPRSYPQKKIKKAIPTRQKNILLLRDTQNRYAIRPRETRFLHGLWEFPEIEKSELKYQFNIKLHSIDTNNFIGKISHAYSHFILEANIHQFDTSETHNEWQWKTAEEISSLPLSRTETKILALISQSETSPAQQAS
ncbi:MAG: A/G-specific adenine glycosylase [Rickettsiales bacterium]|nr:A/G-specific adenine glycosylase [Rickettsiales bacterium]